MILRPRNQHYGWWEAEDLLKHLNERAISIFEALFPGKQALFALDGATRHCTFALDTLRANWMNLGSGGEFL